MSSPAGNNTKDNSSSLVYAEESRKTLGRYTAVGMTNGRYIYQHDDMDRYLEFDESNQNWLIVHEVGFTSGFIYHSGEVFAQNTLAVGGIQQLMITRRTQLAGLMIQTLQLNVSNRIQRKFQENLLLKK